MHLCFSYKWQKPDLKPLRFNEKCSCIYIYISRLNEVMNRVLSIRIDSLIRQGRERDLFLSATHQRTAIWRHCRKAAGLQGRKRAIIKNQICWHLELGLPDSITVRNKFLLLKTFSLLYFVMVAQADTYRQCQAWFLWSPSYSVNCS